MLYKVALDENPAPLDLGAGNGPTLRALAQLLGIEVEEFSGLFEVQRAHGHGWMTVRMARVVGERDGELTEGSCPEWGKTFRDSESPRFPWRLLGLSYAAIAMG